VEVAGAAAVASAGAQTGGVEETGRGRSHRVVRMAGWIRWDGWISGLLGFPDGPFFNFGSTVLLFFLLLR